MSLSPSQQRTNTAHDTQANLEAAAENAITELECARALLKDWLADPANMGPLDDLDDALVVYRGIYVLWLPGLAAAVNAHREALDALEGR